MMPSWLIVRKRYLLSEIRASSVVEAKGDRTDIFEREGMNPIMSTFIYKRDTINVHPPAVHTSIASYRIPSDPYDISPGSFCPIFLPRWIFSNKLSG